MDRLAAPVPRRSIALVVASLAAVLLVGPGLAPDEARANGVGDLYAATTAGVAEVLVATGEVLATVHLEGASRALAFAPDGRTLYTAAGDRALQPIDIETLETRAPISLPGRVESVAHPKGLAVVTAIAGDRRLVFVDPSTGTTIRSIELPGPADLLAADRRQPMVLAAESGKAWLALVDGDGRRTTATLTGRVTAVAIGSGGDLVVATRAPAAVERRTAADLAAEWSVALPAAPDAVAVVAKGIVAAAGRSLWWVDRAGVREWRTLAAPVSALAASDDGTVLYAATAAGLEAIVVDGGRAVRISLDLASGPGVLAPVPRPASLAGAGGPAATDRSSRAPATSTLGPAEERPVDLGLAVVVSLVVLAIGFAVARRLTRVGGA